jgi:RNA polymerase sigma-70 factor (ECF subfamily)
MVTVMPLDRDRNRFGKGGKGRMQYGNPSVTDAELVELSQGGDETAFGQLVQRHRPRCVHLAAFVLQNEGDAEDQVQIAFLNAYKYLNQFRSDAEFSTWLTRIVINQCRMQMRVRRRDGFVAFEEEYMKQKAAFVARLDAESELTRRELRQVLRREIGLMPELLRNVVILHYVRGLRLIEIAAQLRITVPGAKSRLRRARAELRSRIARHYPEVTHTLLAARSVPALDQMCRGPVERTA